MNKIFCFIFTTFCVLAGFSQSSSIRNVDNYLNSYLNRTPVPGFSIVIVENDQVLFEKAYGVEQIGKPTPMTPNSILPIGALGRGFTAMAILQLVEEQKLDLDVPIINYIPWFQTVNKDFSDLITLRMCLSNSSGIPPQYESMPTIDNSADLEGLIRSLSQHIIRRRPGTSHEFCDEGYAIAAYLIERITGMEYADYIQNRIFDPLSMTNSSADHKDLDDIIYGHEMDLEQCIPAQLSIPDPNFAAAGSQYYSTTRDLSHYMIALLNGGYYGNKQVISSESLGELFKPNTSFEGLGTMLGGNGIDIQYALGWMGMSIEERDIMIHTGGNGQAGSILGINKEKNQAFAILFNADVNQFDRFEYPGMEHTVNNVIHILNTEDTTDFGLVRSNLVTEEDYDLPLDLWEKYVGKYESYGDQNPFFKNRIIEIKNINSQRLELTVTRQNEFKGRYRLDFTNETQATLRNISQPRNIQFTKYPDGYIGGLFMFGSQFKKLRPQELERFQFINIPGNNGGFKLPKSITTSWERNVLTGKTLNGANIKISISPLGNNSFNKILKSIKSEKTISEGVINKINIKNGIWTEQTIFGEEGTHIVQYIIALYQDPASSNELTLIVRQPYGSFNDETLKLIQALQKSIIL